MMYTNEAVKTSVIYDYFFFSLKYQEKPSSKIEATNSSRKSDNLRGCDLLQEVSVTIRRFKKTYMSKERLVGIF